MEIYLDILFIKEIFFNFIIIFLDGVVVGEKVNIKRYICASIISSLYTILAIFNSNLVNIFGRITCVILTISVAFNIRSINSFLKYGVIFYFVTFFIAGLTYYTQTSIIRKYLNIISACLMVYLLIKEYKERYKISNYIYDMYIPVLNEKISAFLDTGNFLKDIDGTDVIVISPKIIKRSKNEIIKKILLEGKKIADESYDIRLIQFQTIKGISNKIGIEIDEILVNSKVKKAVLTCSENDLKKYDAIVGLDFLKDVTKQRKEEKLN